MTIRWRTANRDEAWAVMRKYRQHTFWITTKRPENIARMLPPDWPLPNVWLGVSAENQHWADVRMDILRRIPIHQDSIRWVCAEPLLGPIKFAGPSSLADFGWIISGGESSDRKHPPRPANPQWFLDLAAQCKSVGVPFLLMQLGGITKCKCHKAYGCQRHTARTERPSVRRVSVSPKATKTLVELTRQENHNSRTHCSRL